ncbi:MAG: pyrimidine-nucleoside phosphorylase, partial [Oscillospiraceae bacterium]|nr:pyrimidine-nucleoside phosphorylase [Oscillospiraceae bacterium]
QMVVLAGFAESEEEAKKLLMDNVSSGKAFEKFKEFVSAQGGNLDTKLPEAKFVIEVKSKNDGYVSKIHAEGVGNVAMKLGAGRITKESKIDLSVGVVLNKKRGDRVLKGETLAFIHANDLDLGNEEAEELLNCFVIADEYNKDIPLIYGIIK